MPLRSGERRPLIRALAGDGGVEDGAHGQTVENLRGSPDVVALRVREHDHGQAPQPKAANLRRDICLWRPFVDEHRAFAHLE